MMFRNLSPVHMLATFLLHMLATFLLLNRITGEDSPLGELILKDAYGHRYQSGDEVLEDKELYIEYSVEKRSHKPYFTVNGHAIETHSYPHNGATWLLSKYTVQTNIANFHIGVKNTQNRQFCTATFVVKKIYLSTMRDIVLNPEEFGKVICLTSKDGSIQWEQMYPDGRDRVIAIDNNCFYDEFSVTKIERSSTLEILRARPDMNGHKFTCLYEFSLRTEAGTLYVRDLSNKTHPIHVKISDKYNMVIDNSCTVQPMSLYNVKVEGVHARPPLILSLIINEHIVKTVGEEFTYKDDKKVHLHHKVFADEDGLSFTVTARHRLLPKDHIANMHCHPLSTTTTSTTVLHTPTQTVKPPENIISPTSMSNVVTGSASKVSNVPSLTLLLLFVRI